MPGRQPLGRALSRRALLRFTLGGGLGFAGTLLGACRRGSTTKPAPTSASGGPTATVPSPSELPGTPAPGSASTPSPVATPSIVATPTATEEQVFYQWGFTQDPSSHDFNANVNCGGEPEMWAGLLSLDPDMEPIPDWAGSWEINHDATAWTFHLRRDNRGWSNGDPVTAHDFVWSWQRQLDPRTGAPRPSPLAVIKNGDQISLGKATPDALGATALDDWTLQVDLSAPEVSFLSVVASIGSVPAHRASVERYGASWTDSGHCVSNGPFQLFSWQHGTSYTISRNSGYWNAGSVALDRCETPIIAANAGLAPFFAGKVDYAAVPGPDLLDLLSDSVQSQQLHQEVDTAIWMLLPSAGTTPFDDPLVRQAISHAIDRERITQVTEGRAIGATSLMPLGFPAHISDADIATIQQFDVDAALRALQTTPFAGGKAWPATTLAMRQSDPDAELIANDIVAQLTENLGMAIELKVMEPAAFDAAFSEGRLPFTWLRWWFSSPDPDDGYGAIFSSASSTRVARDWSSPAYEAAVATARRTTDSAQRTTLYKQCEQILQSEVVYVPVAYPVTYYIFQTWVANLPTNKSGNLRTRGSIFTRMKTELRIEGRP